MDIRLFDGLSLFDLGRFFIVFGFTLAVIQFVNNLTEFKSPRADNRKKLTISGITAVVGGIGIVLISESPISPTIPNESIAIKGMGTDIIAIGFSCIFQSLFPLKKHRCYLKWGARGLIVLGVIVSIIAVFASVYEWF